MRTFYVVDPNLMDLKGHYFEYARSLIAPVADRGYRYLALGHKKADDVVRSAIPFVPAFSRTIWETFPAVEALPSVGHDASHFISNAYVYSVLRSHLPSRMLGSDAIVLGHMIRPQQLLGWAWWYRQLPAAERPRLVLVFRYAAEWFEGNRFAAAAFRALRAADVDGRLLMATDSDRLSADYGRLVDQEMGVLPIPHTNLYEFGTDQRSSRGELHLVSLGNARDEKGILEILRAIMQLHERGILAGLRFTVQINDIYAPTTQTEIVEVIAAIKALRLTNVRFIDAPLSTMDYYAVLDAADVVLLPYWSSIYRSRTSGVFAEALGAGKVAIVSEDTWMGDQVVAYGGGVLCQDRDVRALVGAINEVRRGFPAYAAAAVEGRTKWLATHNPESFVAACFAGVGVPA